MRGDECEGGASLDAGVGVEKSRGRFRGRVSRSNPRSVAMSEERVGESASNGNGTSARSILAPVASHHVGQQPIMPPRPRPKPKVRPGSSSQPLKEPSLSQDEEDSIFIKSGNLTTAAWKQMNQMPSGVCPS